MHELTALELKRLKPPASGRRELCDSKVPGLRLRVTSKGVRTWSLQVKLRGRKHRYSIGAFPEVPLSEARKRAARLRADLSEGRAPEGPAEPADATAPEIVQPAPSVTVRDALERYADAHCAHLKTGTARMRELSSALASHMERPVATLKLSDILELIDAKISSGAPIAANRLAAALKHFARFLFERDLHPEPLHHRVSKPARERPRDRVLTVAEVREIYRAAADLGPLHAAYYRVLVLTSQRRGEVAQMRWSQIDFEARRWVIPSERSKNGQPHIVHLAEPVCRELRQLRRLGLSGDLVFTTNGETPMCISSKMRDALERAIEVRRSAAVGPKKAPMEHWTLHDLRTAFATALNEEGAQEAVVDRAINHLGAGSRASAVARVYNRSQLLEQRAAVLERWAELIAGSRYEWPWEDDPDDDTEIDPRILALI